MLAGFLYRLLWNLRSLGTPQFLQWVGFFFALLHMFSDSSMRMSHMTHTTHMSHMTHMTHMTFDFDV